MKYFSLKRIQLNKVFTDTYNYLKETYGQSDLLFSEASPWGQIVSVIIRLFGMLIYYIEDSTSELNIRTAYRPSSIQGLASLSGHQITRARCSSGILNLTYNGKELEDSPSKIYIPNYTKLKNQVNSYPYTAIFSTDELIIDLNEATTRSYDIKIFQGSFETQTFTGTGEALQTFEVTVPDGTWIDNDLVNVYVNGQKFEKVVSLYDMTYNANNVIIRTGITSGIDIIFGNENFGAIPTSGSEITVKYLVTDGEFGNLEKTDVNYFNFEDSAYDNYDNEIDLNSVFNISMKTPIILGSSPESISLTKEIAPLNSRSLVLGQTSNYEVFFKKMNIFSNINVYTKYDKFDPYVDNIVYMFLIPDIEKRMGKTIDYFGIDKEMFKLTSHEKYDIYRLIEDSGTRIFGSVPYFVDPTFENYAINLSVKKWSDYDTLNIRENINTVLANYFLKFSRLDYIPKSDIIPLILNIEGIDSVHCDFIDRKIEKLFNYFIQPKEQSDSAQFNTPVYAISSDSEFSDLSISNIDKLKIELMYSDAKKQKIFQFIGDYIFNLKNNIPVNIVEDLYEKIDSVYPDVDSVDNIYICDSIDTWIEIINNNDIHLYDIPSYSDLTADEIVKYILTLPSIKDYYDKYFDSFGNALLQKDVFPIFRGGEEFIDRYGNTIVDDITKFETDKTPINITFTELDSKYRGTVPRVSANQ
ncbi:MAG: hypothetical protein PHV15_01965 [Thomasclavelia ramosa]|nr:hypothetical protein [Thomasclavelia ramosa]